MIPKKIHYVWVGGGELTELAKRCIESWCRFCPDYEIIEWNETNFDIGSSRFASQAYNARKFAYASDVIRLHALYTHGGIYLDTDVELIKPMDKFLEHEAFLSFEYEELVTAWIFGCIPGFGAIKDLLDEYNDREFVSSDGVMNLMPNTRHFTDYFLARGLVLNNQYQTVAGMTVYPSDYFSPKSAKSDSINITDNTHAIHYFDGSWAGKELKLANRYVGKYGRRKGKILFGLRHPIMTVRLLRSRKIKKNG